MPTLLRQVLICRIILLLWIKCWSWLQSKLQNMFGNMFVFNINKKFFFFFNYHIFLCFCHMHLMLIYIKTIFILTKCLKFDNCLGVLIDRCNHVRIRKYQILEKRLLVSGFSHLIFSNVIHLIEPGSLLFDLIQVESYWSVCVNFGKRLMNYNWSSEWTLNCLTKLCSSQRWTMNSKTNENVEPLW